MKNKKSNKNNKPNRLLLSILIMLGFFIASFTQDLASAADPTLSVSPITSSFLLTTSTTISLSATDVENLNAFDVTVTYNPAIITLTGWSHGTLLSNLSTVLVTNNTTTGSLRVVATQINTPGVTGSGVLLNLAFRGIAVGSSPITITQARFSSADVPPVSSYPAITDGTLNVEYGPTAIDLLSFNLTGANHSITLTWETTSELNNLGFNVYRATSITGQRTRLNTNLIPSGSHPGSLLGAQYTFTDTPVDVNCTYYYWIESLDIFGGTKTGGPWSYKILAPQVQPHLSILTHPNSIPADEETSVFVTISEGYDVNSFELKILYDANVVRLESWSYGNYLSNLSLVTLEEIPGLLHLVATQVNTPSVSGNGTLLNLVFKGIRQGYSTLAIVESTLSGASPNSTAVPLVENGSITVTTPSATPAPSLTPAPTKTKTATNSQGSVLPSTATSVAAVITGSTNPINQNPPPAPAPDQVLSDGQTGLNSPFADPVAAPGLGSDASKGGLDATSQEDGIKVDLGLVNNLLWGASILLLTALVVMLIYMRKTQKKDNPSSDR